MRILYLTHSCPYPPNKGDRIRNYHILKHLSKKHQVALIYPSWTEEDENNRDTLSQWCVSVHTVHLSAMVARFRCGLSLIGRSPLTNGYFFSPKIQSLVDEEDYDLALVDCSSMGQYLLGVDKPKIIDFVDVDSDKWHMYAEKTGYPKKFVYNLEYDRLREFEARLLREFDASIVISDQERLFLPQTDRLFVVRNGIDLDVFQPQEETKEQSIIFTGDMNYFPNIDGVLFFAKEVFPFIQQECPSVKFIVGGMNPAPAIQQLASEDILVTGFVQDMRTYLGSATVCVVPLRIAKGIQNKVLEAMAMKVPVVATSLANRGIQAENGQEIMEADHPKDFGRAVVTLLHDHALRQSMAVRARMFVERQFSWEHNLIPLDEAIERAINIRRNQKPVKKPVLV